MANTYYANPYDISAVGFYFTSLEDFNKKFQENLPVEEYEIEFIDGDASLAEVFDKLDVSQGTLEKWFEFAEEYENLDRSEVAAVSWLTNYLSYSLEDAIERAEEVMVYPGDKTEWAEEFLEEVGISDELAHMYVDYVRLGRDIQLEADSDDPVQDMSEQEAGEEYVDMIAPETVKNYFDYESFARDADINGDIAEFHYDGSTYTIANARDF